MIFFFYGGGWIIYKVNVLRESPHFTHTVLYVLDSECSEKTIRFIRMCLFFPYSENAFYPFNQENNLKT